MLHWEWSSLLLPTSYLAVCISCSELDINDIRNLQRFIISYHCNRSLGKLNRWTAVLRSERYTRIRSSAQSAESLTRLATRSISTRSDVMSTQPRTVSKVAPYWSPAIVAKHEYTYITPNCTYRIRNIQLTQALWWNCKKCVTSTTAQTVLINLY